NARSHVVSIIIDGTLSRIDTTTAQPLVPDSIADNDPAALTIGPHIDAVVPRALCTHAVTAESPGAGEPAPGADTADTAAPQAVAAPATAAPSPSARASPSQPVAAAPTTA